jgi:hypothetical protein
MIEFCKYKLIFIYFFAKYIFLYAVLPEYMGDFIRFDKNLATELISNNIRTETR